ncbi:uncharacterized protein LOC124171664 [Ischnura elegans]|uniref:uncharacterized protein LOC124171664 n=1 Tax=Ischnura elegans TaxID=197161 RepID=UPI001ED89BDB|nr:uncharacterized protein LOC124171664 [Ischnura elegans]
MSVSWKEALLQFAVSELSRPTCSFVVDHLKDEIQSSRDNLMIAALGAVLMPSYDSSEEVVKTLVNDTSMRDSFSKIPRKESSLGRYFCISSDRLECLVQDVGMVLKSERCPYISLQDGILFVAWMLCQTGSVEPPKELVEPYITCHYLGKIIKALASISSERISWPSRSQTHEIVDAFDKLYGFPGVVGVLVISRLPILMPEDMKSDVSVCYSIDDFYDSAFDCPTVAFQVVVDHKEEMRDVCVGLPGSWHSNKVLRSSRLYSKLIGSGGDDNSMLITEGYHLLADIDYYHLPTLITPHDLKVSGASQFRNSYNQMHREALNSGYAALSNFFSKFSRLKTLNVVDRWNPMRKEFKLGDDICHSVSSVTLAACVLHNSSLNS